MIAFNANDFSDSFPSPLLTGEAISLQTTGSLLKQYLTHRLSILMSHCFTAIDRAFIVWGVLTLVIFSLAQFSTISWTTQAVLDAALTGIGIATTSSLTWAIASEAKLRWVVLLWAGLMSTGSIATGYGIFCGSVLILLNLCPLWLGLCAAGYGAMAIGMQSRCFTVAFLVHLGALALPLCKSIAFLSQTISCQFLTSGLVIALTLFFFSVVPWDRKTP